MDRSFLCVARWTVLVASLAQLNIVGVANATIGGEGEELIGYDVIVNELNRESSLPAGNSSRARQAVQRSKNPFDTIWIHAGIGLAAMMQQVSLDNGNVIHFNQKGFQASLGIDLFSPNWMAEGLARSFGESDDTDHRVSLKEFELKLLYKDRFSRSLGFRAGGGLAARYMAIRSFSTGPMEYTTPSSVATLGMDLFLNDKISIGADISARNSMISETLDRNSFDATLRMDTHF